MKKRPAKIDKLLEKLIEDVNNVFGDRAKKLYYTDLMQEEILTKTLI